MPDFRNSTVLFDEPALQPVLGLDDHAQAVADLVLHREPRFATGILGDWWSEALVS